MDEKIVYMLVEDGDYCTIHDSLDTIPADIKELLDIGYKESELKLYVAKEISIDFDEENIPTP